MATEGQEGCRLVEACHVVVDDAAEAERPVMVHRLPL